MTELTNIEICEQVAKICFPDAIFHGNKDDKHTLFSYNRHVAFNPLGDDKLCFQLMIMQEVNLLHDASDYPLKTERNDIIGQWVIKPNKDILLHIIERHNVEFIAPTKHNSKCQCVICEHKKIA